MDILKKSRFGLYFPSMLVLLIAKVCLADSTYTVTLDTAFARTFSTLEYSLLVEQKCGSEENGTESTSQLISSDNRTSYTFSVANCRSNQQVKAVNVKFYKAGGHLHQCEFDVKTSQNNVVREQYVGASNCEMSEFYDSFLSNNASSKLAECKIIPEMPEGIFARFAPTTYLCDRSDLIEGGISGNNGAELSPRDMRPFNVEKFLQYVELCDSSGTCTPASSHENFSDSTEDHYFKSIDPRSYLGEVVLNDAPYYVHVKPYKFKSQNPESRDEQDRPCGEYDESNFSGFIDIQYWVFYGLNGSQFFQAEGGMDFYGNFITDPKQFVWSNYARHEGDWEHVTMRVFHPEGTDDYELLGVLLSAHGEARLIGTDELEFDRTTHPKVYSACNSHAFNNKRKVFNKDSESLSSDGLNYGLACGLTDLAVIDEGSNSSMRWAPWDGSNIFLLDPSLNCTTLPPAWINFKGTYGPAPENVSSSISGLDGYFAPLLFPAAMFPWSPPAATLAINGLIGVETCLLNLGTIVDESFEPKGPTAPRGPSAQGAAWTNRE